MLCHKLQTMLAATGLCNNVQTQQSGAGAQPVTTSQKLGVFIVHPSFPLSFPTSLSPSLLPALSAVLASLHSLPSYFCSSLSPSFFPSSFSSQPSFFFLPYLPFLGAPPLEASYRIWGSSVSSLSRSGQRLAAKQFPCILK